MNISKTSFMLVAVQFITGLFLLVTSSIRNVNLITLFLILTGIVIGLWGVVTMRKGIVRVVPEVADKAMLITDGPYKWIRHPMYSGVIIVGLGLLLTDITFIRVIVFLVLITDLIIKLHYEERMLEQHFPNYSKYKKKTNRLLPYIY